jgi:hypothetical protein
MVGASQSRVIKEQDAFTVLGSAPGTKSRGRRRVTLKSAPNLDRAECEQILSEESMLATGRARVVEDHEQRLRLPRRFKDRFDARLGLDSKLDPVTEAAAARCGCIVIALDEVSGRREGQDRFTVCRRRTPLEG